MKKAQSQKKMSTEGLKEFCRDGLSDADGNTIDIRGVELLDAELRSRFVQGGIIFRFQC